MTLGEQFKQLVDKLEREMNRKDERLEEYFCLVQTIERLADNSNSKLAEKVSSLIEKHYEL